MSPLLFCLGVSAAVMSAVSCSQLPRFTGVVQRSDKNLSCPETVGVHLQWDWADIETSNGQFNFSDFDSRLQTIVKWGKRFDYTIKTGAAAPEWLYTNGVPRVVVDFPGQGNLSFPYYLNEQYRGFFRRMVRTVAEHVTSLESSVLAYVVGVDVVIGSTGDVAPWHGEPLNPKFVISRDAWLDFWKNETLYFVEQYSKLALDEDRLFIMDIHGLEDIEGLTEQVAAVLTNYHFSNAAHEICKQYQETNERLFLMWNDTTYNMTHTERKGNLYVKAHCFQDHGLKEGAMNPVTSAWETFLWALTWNLDRIYLMDWEFDGSYDNNQLWPMLRFVNKYLSVRKPELSPGAWVRLHDGLNSADTERFPESQYGKASLKNAGRMVNITKSMANAGAAQDDPEHAAMNTQAGRQRTGWNDAGWEILADNYGMYMRQWQPLETSIGHWRVGQPNSSADMAYWGRFARAFHHQSGKDDMFFDIDNDLAAVLQSLMSVYVRVVYYDDDKGGQWKLFYDSTSAKSCQSAIAVTKTGTGTWKEVRMTLSDARLANGCPHGTDAQLSSVDGKDDIFAFLEFSKTPFE